MIKRKWLWNKYKSTYSPKTLISKWVLCLLEDKQNTQWGAGRTPEQCVSVHWHLPGGLTLAPHWCLWQAAHRVLARLPSVRRGPHLSAFQRPYQVVAHPGPPEKVAGGIIFSVFSEITLIGWAWNEFYTERQNTPTTMEARMNRKMVELMASFPFLI